MAAAFGYVGHSAFARYREEGAATGLFDTVGGEHTLRRVREQYGAALESLVAALRRREEGGLSAEEMALMTTGLARRFGLTDGQTAVLSRAADALAREREQTRRLDALVAVGHQSRMLTDERELLRGAVQRIAVGFEPDAVRIGLLEQGRLVFPAELATDPSAPVDPTMQRAAGTAVAAAQPIRAEPGVLVLPLMVKELPAGVLAVQRAGAAVDGPDSALFASLASQLSIGLENVRLYVAAALIADPSQAALGGAVFDVTILFADLSGFTSFSERSSPPEVVTMLNRYFEVATAAILAENGTIVQYIGDALMALFNAPVRQADHASRAARAALAMQRGVDTLAAQIPGWPRFRVGVNTGEALVGNIGSEALRNYNATGDAVNVAARLETLARPGQVVVGGATYTALDGSAHATPLGDVVVKGRRQPVTAYLLHDLRLP